MRRAPLSLAGVGLALLHALASGFSRPAPAPPLPTRAAFHARQPRTMGARRTERRTAAATDAALAAAAVRGGSDAAAPDLDLTVGAALASLWGAGGVVYILAKAIARVLPLALEPWRGGAPLTRFQLAAYVATCLFFAYAEGYKGFQRKFSPLVVARAFTLRPATSPLRHLLLGPLYSMALLHATRRRLIVSWCVTTGVAGVVVAVKRLPYPWRNVVDAGVCVGLTWGSAAILGGYALSLATGIAPIGVDPALPEQRE